MMKKLQATFEAKAFEGSSERTVDIPVRTTTHLLDVRGDYVKLLGVDHSEATLLVSSKTVLVVRFAGRSENPGSRFSGLRKWVPASTAVYLILEQHAGGQDGRFRVVEVIEWESKSKKPL